MKKGYPVGIVGEDFTASTTLIEINQVLAVKKKWFCMYCKTPIK